MPRPQTVSDDELFDRLAQVFRVAGFEGASLGALADGARLRRASLYHRFPEGKVQMAEAVMGRVGDQFARAIEPMTSAPDVAAGVVESARRISEIYADGLLPCVLDTLTLSGAPEGIRAKAAEITTSWIEAMAVAARRGGARPADARLAAEEAFVRIEGSLVLARLNGTPTAFRRAITELPRMLLGGS
ncbi:TetR/AcrR family transcriptional regulator [Pseudonocardia sp. DSM 110487]|uniref:TetR/AcrR family transcriptional regulator n=1 Tax=Pseudonocardia sp. DSM 110487 TaxID=2865833 RepID=UPI001C6A113C|nr:TetR/AcrR family transcriptional regulator [Pseudonocardia sp. DSM 110487]QYN32456.1 TetR/AcrR family transcriptional regulator [Pseudonocardia sp. DSM 110487]